MYDNVDWIKIALNCFLSHFHLLNFVPNIWTFSKNLLATSTLYDFALHCGGMTQIHRPTFCLFIYFLIFKTHVVLSAVFIPLWDHTQVYGTSESGKNIENSVWERKAKSNYLRENVDKIRNAKTFRSNTTKI